jgi:NTE family protein
MRRGALVLALLLGARGLQAQSCPAGPHGLVLSGGGARGFAQLGVLGILDSAGFAPDLIVDTSSGALLGALYATGFSPRQIDSIAQDAGIAGVFGAGAPLSPRAFGQLTPLLFWEQGRGGLNIFSSSALDTRLNARLNIALLESNLAAAGSFDSLDIPFTAIAADLQKRERVLLRTGDLAQAVRASMSIPLLFQPQEINGVHLVDGAVVDNVPVLPARQLGARHLTIVDVTTGSADSVDFHSTTALARHLLEQQMLDDRDSLSEGDRYIRPDLAGFLNLDVRPERLRESVERGAAAARSSLARWSCPGPRRAPRQASASLRIDSVRITTVRGADRRYLQRALGLWPGDTVDRGRIAATFRAIERSPEPREVWLHPRRTEGGVSFDAELAPPPARVGGIMLGYDHDYGGRFGALLLDRTPGGRDLQLAALMVISRYQQRGAITLRTAPPAWNPVVPALHLRTSHEALHRYEPGGGVLPSLSSADYEVQLAVEKFLGRHWSFSAGPLLHGWDLDSAHGHSIGAAARISRGSELRRPMVELDGVWTNEWWSAGAGLEAEDRHDSWSFRLIGRGTASNDAPLHRLPTLGGTNGFPGYAVFDLRGEQTAYGELSAAHIVARPFEVRIAVAGGRSWRSHTDAWLGGARLTLELPTPVGDLRAGYGRATSGNGAVFVRVGAWF